MIASSVILITGPTGRGKTSLLATLVEWVFETYGLITRLATADGGGFGSKMDALARLGMVQVWKLRTRAGSGGEGLVEETMARAASGWWPSEFRTGPGGEPTGETLPKVRLLPPVETTYRMKCKAGHVLRETTERAELRPTRCTQCGTTVDLRTAMVEESQRLAPHMTGIGAYCFEGLTSWSNWQLASLADRRGRGDLHGEKSNIGGFRSGDMLMDGNNRADYGFAQGAAEKWLLASTAIPGLVVPPVWTGLETRTDESETVAAHWGPAIAGQARTWQVPQWCGDWLGAQKVANEKGRVEYRLYTGEFRGEDGLTHPYKVRCEPGLMPEYFSDAEGEAFSGFNLGLYLGKVAEAEKVSAQRAETKYGEKLKEVLAKREAVLAQQGQKVVAEEVVEEPQEAGEEPAPAAAAAAAPPALRPALPRARAPVPIRRR